MKLFLALALLTVASALPDGLLLSLKKRDTELTNAGFAVVDPSPIQLEDTYPTEETSLTAMKTTKSTKKVPSNSLGPSGDLEVEDLFPVPVKVTNSKHFHQSDVGEVRVADSPSENPEDARQLFPELNLIDISPMIVPEEVMQRVEEMAAINGAAGPFSFNSAEPLDRVEPVIMVNSPTNELNAKMDPVMVVDSATDEQPPFDQMSKNLENVKIVDLNVPMESRPVPKEMWRGVPQSQFPFKPMPNYFRDSPKDILRMPYNVQLRAEQAWH